MKRIAHIIFLILFLVFPAGSFGADQAKAISQFEEKVMLFEKFFQTGPKVIEKQEFSRSPSNHMYFYNQYKLNEVSYDIQKTTSLVSPYKGYIDVNCRMYRSKKCGDLALADWHFFSSLDNCRKNKNNSSCYAYLSIDTARFIFAYQKGKWVFKNVISPDSSSMIPAINTAFGKPTSGRLPLKDNNHWKKLIQ